LDQHRVLYLARTEAMLGKSALTKRASSPTA
jgi:hypothetical protein